MATETLRPNAAGDLTQLTPSGAAQNWDCVDETPSDGDTTCVWQILDSVNELTDLYNLPDTAIPAGSTINSVKIYITSRSASNTYRSIQRTKIKTGGTVYNGANNSPPTTYTQYSTTYTTNPNTGLAWTIAQINALQAGVGIIAGGNELTYFGRCTQVYVEIDYTEPAGAVKRALRNLVMDEEWR